MAGKKLKTYQVFTCEHRKYHVKATSYTAAKEYIKEQANLAPKDKRVELVTFGDFEITV